MKRKKQEKPDPSDIPEFDRVMRGLVNVDPTELDEEQEVADDDRQQDEEAG